MVDFRNAAALTVLVAGFGFGLGANAEGESGAFRALHSFGRDHTVLDHAGAAYVVGSMVGTHTVIESTGGPFAERSSGVMECLVHGKISDEDGLDLTAPCSMTDGDGDNLFLSASRWAGDVKQGSGGDGAAIILGGDGKYAGMDGVCSYSTDYLSDTQLVADVYCDWKRVSE